MTTLCCWHWFSIIIDNKVGTLISVPVNCPFNHYIFNNFIIISISSTVKTYLLKIWFSVSLVFMKYFKTSKPGLLSCIFQSSGFILIFIFFELKCCLISFRKQPHDYCILWFLHAEGYYMLYILKKNKWIEYLYSLLYRFL